MGTIVKTSAGEEIMQKISESGYKLTESRRVLVELALKHEGHFSAADLYETIKSEAPSVGRATVFRTLDLLTSMQLLEKIHLGDGCHSYVVCQSRHHHHLICNTCGLTIDFENCHLNELLQDLSRLTNFSIKGHWLEVFGQCERCQNKEQFAVTDSIMKKDS
ncbi:Fur family transcriptional regulator [Candidatus Chlorohelix sp.]|uniref:Fur family transcriptional regulator n=1 Tax=Candidatus Chlorohelix sp. TaxID=3139201 RepID=UPI0030292968